MVNYREIHWQWPWQRWQRRSENPLPFWAERIQDGVWIYPAADGWHGRQGMAAEVLAAAMPPAGEPVAMLLPETEVLRCVEELPDVAEDELAEIIRWERDSWFPDLEKPLLRKQCLHRENGHCLWEFAAVESERLPQTVWLPETTPRVYVTERDALAYALPAGTGVVVCADAEPRQLHRYENYICTGSEVLPQDLPPAKIAAICGGTDWYVHTCSAARREEYLAAGASRFPGAVAWEPSADGIEAWQAADYLAVAVGYAAARAPLRWETGAPRHSTFCLQGRALRSAAGVVLAICVLAGMYAAGGRQEYATAREMYSAQEEVRIRLTSLQAAERKHLATAAAVRRQPARSTLLVILADSVPAGVTFQELQAEGGRAVLKGAFTDLAELQQWQSYLRQRLRTEVRLKYERNQGNGGTFLLNWREVQDAENLNPAE